MPSLKITFNGKTEVRVNLHEFMATAFHLNWIGEPGNEDNLCWLHIGGVEGSEQVRWDTPELAMGDVITIQLCEESVENTPTTRTTVPRF